MGKEIGKNSASGSIDTKFQSLLNEQNLDLWNELCQFYNFELEESPECGYLVYFDNNSVIIEIDMQDLTPASFTHELLHVYIKAKGIHIARELKEKIIKNPELGELFSTSLRVHIGNCLEHVKMLPFYISRGFKNEDFISDFGQTIIDDKRMQDLEQNYYEGGKPVLAMVDIFMDKFFALSASNNPYFDYTLFEERLEKLDPSLYTIHYNFWRAWEHFEIGDPKENYLRPLDNYLKELLVWKRMSFKGAGV